MFAQTTAAPSLLEGSVLNKLTGSPVKNAHVMYIKVASPAGENTLPISTDTDADGRFSIQLQAGSYRLWAERPGYARQPYGSLTPDGAGQVVTVGSGEEMRGLSMRMVPLGAIAGRIVDEQGEPMQGVGIQVLRFSYATGRRQLIPVAGASSNDLGEYRAYGLPAGKYFLLATLRGAPLSRPVEVSSLVPEVQQPFASMYYPGVLDPGSASPIALGEGGELNGIDFHLERVRAVTLRGRILSPVEDFAGSQLQVVLSHNEGNAASFIDRASATIDRVSGRFEFRGIAPGSYVLHASQLYRGQPLGGRVLLDVGTASLENIAVALAPGVDMTASVEMEGGTPAKLSNTTLRLLPVEGLALGAQPAGKIGANGSVHLAAVTPGLWQFVLDSLPEGVWVKSASYNDLDVLRGEFHATGARGVLRIVLSSNGAQISGAVLDNGQPHRATVVLAPASSEMQGAVSMYRSVPTQDQGTYVFKGVRPGTYKLYAFEDVEPFAWLDPDFLKPIDARGESISVLEGDRITKQLAPVPVDAISPVK